MGELKKRVFAAICLAPLIALLFYLPNLKWFFLFLVVVAAFAVFEVFSMSGTGGRFVLSFIAMVSAIPLYWNSFQLFILWVAFSPVFYFGFVCLCGDTKKEDINHEVMRGINLLLVSQIFIILPVFYLYFLKQKGDMLPMILLFSLWASDSCAYFLGKNFGKRPLAPRISPKKTYEGLLGAMAGSMLVIVLFSCKTGMGILEALIVGAIIGILGQIGDILESVGKRVCAVKDSSGLIPGHGGILDRMDSFIFTAPFMYYYISGIRI